MGQGHSTQQLNKNVWKYYEVFYQNFLYFTYHWSVPVIILYGLFSKPVSPIVLAAWGYISGQEEIMGDMMNK